MSGLDPVVDSELPNEQVADFGQPPPAPRKGMTRRLVGGTLNYGVGQALPQLLRFLLLPIFTLYLTPADYGVLGLAGSFGTLMVQFMRLGVPGAVTRFYYDHREGRSLTDYVTTIAIFLLGSSAVIGLATLLIGPWLFERLIPGLSFFPFGLLALGTAVISCNQNLQDRLVQAREQASYMALLNIGRALISLVLSLWFVVALRLGCLWHADGRAGCRCIAVPAGRSIPAPQPAWPLPAGNAAHQRQVRIGRPAESSCL